MQGEVLALCTQAPVHTGRGSSEMSRREIREGEGSGSVTSDLPQRL